MQNPLMIAVAPNGARKTKKDHPALPIHPKELGETAKACLRAGACMIHLHVRDKNNGHSLDPYLYKEAISAIQDAVGDNLIVQVTTEAVGIYQPEQQIQAVKKVRPEAVSVALREFCPDASYEKAAGEFFQWMYKERISPQYILYDLEDLGRFKAYCKCGLVPGNSHTILLVLGRYTLNQQSDPKDLDPLLTAIPEDSNWWLCAFGKNESACMTRVIDSGGHCRVGFENNLYLSTGEIATDNAESVRAIKQLANKKNRTVADAALARSIMNFR